MYASFGKRLVDLLLSGIATIALSPVLLLTASAIRFEDGAPIVYRQRRVGQSGRTFTVLKFRSMPTGTKVAPSAGMGAATVTKVGRIIRRLNVDELPQLFNILRGEMSVVGPRPALPSQTTLISDRARGAAHDARPGLTGLAQIRAYDGMTEAAKAAYDNQYAERVTLLNDLKIIASTVGYLFKPPPTY
ncbi:sugar transferase [Nocardioides sediminis]|uniref:sugar transferase n=1 Tax=Nocardioides sediminis TaxID=433648 RepID=UPI000D30F28A|nr:sugar transferase [Nocardioides sediminis]